MKTYSEGRIELRNLQILKKILEMSWSSHQSSPVSRKAWMLSWILQELKKYARKTCDCGQHWGPFDSSLDLRSVSDGGNLCPLWLDWWFSNQFDIVSETPYSCNEYSWPWAVVSYTLLAAVSWNGLEPWFTSKSKVVMFILTDFKKWCFDVSFLTSICVNNYFETEKSWIC